MLKIIFRKRRSIPGATDHFASPDERVSLSDSAYLVIRDKILRNDLPLGAPLSRRKLTARKTSRRSEWARRQTLRMVSAAHFQSQSGMPVACLNPDWR
jgi:hypothetical protein